MLDAISPIDGRYASKTLALQQFFSESALMKYRVKVEIEYFIALSETKLFKLNKNLYPKLRDIYELFSTKDAKHIKKIESTTNHDVKAIEYFIKEKFDSLGLSSLKEWVHFGLTSQDINNTAFPLMWKDALERIYIPQLKGIISVLKKSATTWRKIPMLARTHGQPASPTSLGKEIYVFVERLENQLNQLKNLNHSGKFGGATGNFNAHIVAFPNTDWQKFGNLFLKKYLNIDRQQTTTQIEHYDGLASNFDNIKRINTILVDLSRDIWHYISIEFFKQKLVKNEVGSSAMPHKVNPIDFENAEGNLLFANSIFTFLSEKLPVSRLQRDLTDSTVLRNIGVPLSHTIIAFQSLQKGWSKLELNKAHIQNELNKNWIILAEAIQTILRREQYEGAYEALKALTRGNTEVNKTSLHLFIDELKIKDALKLELKKLTPFNYIGNSEKFGLKK